MALPSSLSLLSTPASHAGRTSTEAATTVPGATVLAGKYSFTLASKDPDRIVYRQSGVAPSRASTVELLSSTLKSGDIRRAIRINFVRNVYDENGLLIAAKRPATVNIAIDIPPDMIWGDPAISSAATMARDALELSRLVSSAWTTTDIVHDGVTLVTGVERANRNEFGAAMRYWLTGDLL